MGDFAPDGIDLPGRGGGGGFAGFQDGVQAGAELLGGFEVGLVGGGFGGAGQGFDLAGLHTVLTAVGCLDAVQGKLHVGGFGGFT